MNAATARTIEVNGQRLSFSLRRSPRRTLAISVEPDGRVVVTAPELASPERIEVILARRFPWIKRQQRYFEALPPPPTPRQWVSGETHRYLGRQYRLKVIAGETTSVRLTGSYFHVTTPDPTNTAAIEQAMAAWYHSHARTLFAARMAKILKDTTWLRDLTAPPITVRHMPKRWGSATPSGRIYLNVDLVKLPPGCIDYVIAHELVHLKIPNHGRAFWKLLGRVCPEWGRWRDRLAR